MEGEVRPDLCATKTKGGPMYVVSFKDARESK